MSTSTDICNLVIAALMGNTDAGVSVWAPMDIPSVVTDYPMLIVTDDSESGDSLGNMGAPAFNVVTTITVSGRMANLASADDVGAATLNAAMKRLRDQIKACVINGRNLMGPVGPVQEFKAFRSNLKRSTEPAAEHNGEITVEFDIEFYQGDGDFFIPPSVPLKEVAITYSVPLHTPLTGADIINLDA